MKMNKRSTIALFLKILDVIGISWIISVYFENKHMTDLELLMKYPLQFLIITLILIVTVIYDKSIK